MSDKLRGGTTIGGHTALHMGNIEKVLEKTDSVGLQLENYISEMFAGQISMFSGYSPPSGWLVADGSYVKKTDYPYLWNYVSKQGHILKNDQSTGWYYAFNPGAFQESSDGLSFKLPDLRGVFLRSIDKPDGLDMQGMREPGNLQLDFIKSHKHTGSVTGGSHDHSYKTLKLDARSPLVRHDRNNNEGYSYETRSTESGGSHTHNLTINSTGGVENTVKNVSYITCIKY